MENQSKPKLLVASNRGPVNFDVDDHGERTKHRGGGGLVTALSGLFGTYDVTWISHALSDEDASVASESPEGLVEEFGVDSIVRLQMVGQPDPDFNRYYHDISNPLLWFIHHRLYGFGWDPSIGRSTYLAWRSYEEVNQRIAAKIIDELGDDEIPLAMIHDYHLFLVPGLVRSSKPSAVLHFFLHIPWPGPGAWRALPDVWIQSICESLLAADIIGFQTEQDAANFGRTVEQFTDAVYDSDSGTVELNGEKTKLQNYPISVMAQEFKKHKETPRVKRLRERIASYRPDTRNGRLIVRIDRTDPSKNIVRGFQAFALMLREHPELHGNVSMFCQLDPSRQDIAEYVNYLAQTKTAAANVNHRYGTENWTPIHVNLDSNFSAAVAAYLEYDVLFVNPVADGMNLVSKEGPLVNEQDGVVVLSNQAGSFNELGEHVIPVNPFDLANQADALYEALIMDRKQKEFMASRLREQVTENGLDKWIDDQIRDISDVREAVLS